MPQITKTQRWLDLIACLAGRRFPVSAAEVMELPAYQSMRPDTARRVFERDKTGLRAAGVPLETVRCSSGGNEPGDGYLLSAGDFYLPYLKIVDGARRPSARPGRSVPGTVELHASEAADALEALSRAARVPGSPLAEEARRAHAKLALDLEPDSFPGAPVALLESPADGAAAPALRDLADAVLERRMASFVYHGIRRGESTERVVRPYGLIRTGGNWYLIAFDPARDAVREFRVGRMERLAIGHEAGAFPSPEGFRLEDHLGREAWELGHETPALARVRFAFPLTLWADRNRRGELVREDADGAQVREFSVRQPEPFLRWLLSLGPLARVESPRALAAEAAQLAREALARHGGASG